MERRGANRWPANKAMKLTRLSAAPGWFREYPGEGAASCPRRRETAGTASQLIASVRRTQRGRSGRAIACMRVRRSQPFDALVDDR